MIQKSNPIIYSDFPDIDIIRVKDTYYMASTTMHFMPGGSILRSYDLVNWEHISYVYDELDETSAQRLVGNENIYGQGMWAPSFRYDEGVYYYVFAANDTKKTYVYTATDIKGPWTKNLIEGFYHDSSLFFDNNRVFIIYGNKTIFLTELEADLSKPKIDGLHRIIAVDEGDVGLGYEGAKIYKKDGRYYLFLIHWPATGNTRRNEVCLMANDLEADFLGKTIIDDDLGFFNQGIAQGGMVDTPDGDWYMFMFQDRGAVGRVPIMIPMVFIDHMPTIKGSKIPRIISIANTKPNHEYAPLNINDHFDYQSESQLALSWQFNHQPNNDLWSVTERKKAFRIYSGKISPNLTQAQNTLTQRTTGPASFSEVTLDATYLKEGDIAGICVLQGCYGAIALKKENQKYYLVMIGQQIDADKIIMGKVLDNDPPIEYARIAINSAIVTLRVHVDFKNLKDVATFYYKENDLWQQLGIMHQLYFKLDHFVGCRFGLFLYSTEQVGGLVDFLNFKYVVE